MNFARGMLAAALFLGGGIIAIRRLAAGWDQWRHLLEFALAGVAMALAPIIVHPDSLPGSLLQALVVGGGFCILYWLLGRRKNPDTDDNAAEGFESPTPELMAGLRAALLAAIVLTLTSIALAVLGYAGLWNSLAAHILQAIGVICLIYCSVVSLRLWLRQR